MTKKKYVIEELKSTIKVIVEMPKSTKKVIVSTIKVIVGKKKQRISN